MVTAVAKADPQVAEVNPQVVEVDPRVAGAEARAHLAVHPPIPAVARFRQVRPGQGCKEVLGMWHPPIQSVHPQNQPSEERFDLVQARQGFPQGQQLIGPDSRKAGISRGFHGELMSFTNGMRPRETLSGRGMAKRMRVTGLETIRPIELDSTTKPKTACATGRAKSPTTLRLVIGIMIIIGIITIVTGGVTTAR